MYKETTERQWQALYGLIDIMYGNGRTRKQATETIGAIVLDWYGWPSDTNEDERS